jgi:hypothetical protein
MMTFCLVKELVMSQYLKELREEVTRDAKGKVIDKKSKLIERRIQRNLGRNYISLLIDCPQQVYNMSDADLKLLVCIAMEMEYDTGYVDLSNRVRTKLCKGLNITRGTLRNKLTQLRQMNYISDVHCDVVEVTPLLFHKGAIKDVSQRRHKEMMRKKM